MFEMMWLILSSPRGRTASTLGGTNDGTVPPSTLPWFDALPSNGLSAVMQSHSLGEGLKLWPSMAPDHTTV